MRLDWFPFLENGDEKIALLSVSPGIPDGTAADISLNPMRQIFYRIGILMKCDSLLWSHSFKS
jgi:hypothetical protein